ncbi:MAG: hypothetical protein Kow0010_24570 [Dehalococcoidia bacterium]
MFDDYLAEARIAELTRMAGRFEPPFELDQQHRRSEAAPPTWWVPFVPLALRYRRSATSA